MIGIIVSLSLVPIPQMLLLKVAWWLSCNICKKKLLCNTLFPYKVNKNKNFNLFMKTKSHNFTYEKDVHNKEAVTESKNYCTTVASMFPFMRLSATVIQQLCNCCRKKIFSISAATFAKNIFDIATVCFVSTYKVIAVCLLHDCCATCFILKLASATFLFFT